MLDSYSLGCQRVFEGCTVTLSVLAVIEHHFKGVSTPIVVVLDESLSTILRRIATILCEDVAKLRFTFSTVSGEVAESAREWLPDRFQLFKAKDAIGSAAEEWSSKRRCNSGLSEKPQTQTGRLVNMP